MQNTSYLNKEWEIVNFTDCSFGYTLYNLEDMVFRNPDVFLECLLISNMSLLLDVK